MLQTNISLASSVYKICQELCATTLDGLDCGVQEALVVLLDVS